MLKRNDLDCVREDLSRVSLVETDHLVVADDLLLVGHPTQVANTNTTKQSGARKYSCFLVASLPTLNLTPSHSMLEIESTYRCLASKDSRVEADG